MTIRSIRSNFIRRAVRFEAGEGVLRSFVDFWIGIDLSRDVFSEIVLDDGCIGDSLDIVSIRDRGQSQERWGNLSIWVE